MITTAGAGLFRGGPAIVTALFCAFFTSFTGASGVTILTSAGVLMPVLLAATSETERAGTALAKRHAGTA
jgi:TRAP-type C4-dicarboxylate transport system permease large subunit